MQRKHTLVFAEEISNIINTKKAEKEDMESKESAACAKCPRNPCASDPEAKKPAFCPMINRKEAIERAMKRYDQEISFYQASARQERDGYMRPSEIPIKCRVEEIMEFAEKMGYRKIGVAFCIGLKDEALRFAKILENVFEVSSVCCKCGAFDKKLMVDEEDKIQPGAYEAMCNPIAQAEILNDEHTDFNIVLGLCVGHDSLFFKYSEAPVTVLAVKDRLLGHNPLAALYSSYYSRLLKSARISHK